MGDVALIGLEFSGVNSNRFQSSNPNQAPGSTLFYACTLIQLKESLLTGPTEAVYFGNSNTNLGWEIGRDADTAAVAPTTPELITLRCRLGHNGTFTDLTYSTDGVSMFGRTHLIAVSLIGATATMYVNGTVVAQATLAGAYGLGNVGLAYGNRAGGGARSGDPVIAAAYTDTDAANFILFQKALFDLLRSTGKFSASITALGLSAGYVYESFQQKAPIFGTPTEPLKNYGTFSAAGNLTFAGSAPLVVNNDSDPDYTGGAQSTGTGDLENLQGAYDVGPTGLIVTGANGPVGVDDILIQNNEIFTETGATPSNLEINAGGTTTDGDPGADLALTSGVGGDETGAGSTAGAGGNITAIAGNAGNTAAQADGGAGGTVFVSGGDGSDVTSPDAGSVGGTGGQVIIQGGDGGDGTDGSAFAGNGGEVNIEAGGAGAVAAGAAEGVGGLFSASGGNGGTGTGGEARLRSGNGDVASGDLNIFVGSSGGVVGLLTVRGGAAQGVGSGSGGGVQIIGGAAANGQSQPGGAVALTGGPSDGTATGAPALVQGGVSDVGPGGAASVIAGDGGGGGIDNGGFGGNAIVSGGNATQPNQPAGNVQIEGGDATGTGAPAFGGAVEIRAGDSTNSDGGNILVASGNGTTVTDAGTLQLSFASASGSATGTMGGFFLDPANGRLSLRSYAIGGGVETGSLKLHTINTAGEAAQAITDGLLHFRTEQAGGVATTLGFRAAKSGDWGLMARAFNRTFTSADAGGDVLHVVHNLDSHAVTYAVYDPAGGKAFESVTQIAGVQEISTDQIDISFVSGYLGAGTYRVTVVGY